MKLKVFHAADGDSLLLSSSDGHHALVDGGRTGTFRAHTWGTLQDLAAADEALDLVVVSHIDADHISGILWLMKAVAAWAVFDYQTTEGGNPGFPAPTVTRPPAIKKVWHNSWAAQLGDLAGPIEAFATRVDEARSATALDASTVPPAAADMFDALQGLAESIPDGVELLRVVDDDTPIPRNKPFKDLVLLRDTPHVEKLGKARLTVIGPARKHLERLREEWREWLHDKPAGGHQTGTADGGEATAAASGLGTGSDLTTALAAARAQSERLIASLAAAARIIVETDPTKVTPPNRASITLLAEEKKATCLLTGDAAEEEILDGLRAAGRIVDGRFDCDVLKVQHHGSEYNLSRRFAETVIADHYVFCADGAHDNPDPSVVRTVVETRRAVDQRPFTVWFNCSPERTLASRRKAMRAAIREATSAMNKQSGITVKVLDDAESFLELTV